MSPLSLLARMTHTRLELVTLDLEAHASATLAALGFAIAAFVLALVALTFAGVAVIAVFWDTHRILAATLTTGVYVALAVSLVAIARRRWRARPDPFAATFRELELDGAAVREAA